MGQLDEATFEAKLGPCTSCGGTRHELRSFIDQRVTVMLADVTGTPRWVHDGEKFVDGTYWINCASCGHKSFTSDDCPRCDAAGLLAAATGSVSRLVVPRTCPTCKNTELIVTALVSAAASHGGGRTQPRALAELGETGFHVVEIECDDCGVIAEAAGCPLCATPGPLRARP